MNDKQTLKDLKRILKVSKSVKLERIRQALGLDQETFNKKIFAWAEQFGFEIDREYVNITKTEVEEFIEYLEGKFNSWNTHEGIEIGKIDAISEETSSIKPIHEEKTRLNSDRTKNNKQSDHNDEKLSEDNPYQSNPQEIVPNNSIKNGAQNKTKKIQPYFFITFMVISFIGLIIWGSIYIFAEFLISFIEMIGWAFVLIIVLCCCSYCYGNRIGRS